MRLLFTSLLLSGAVAVAGAQQPRVTHGRVFPPEKLAELAPPDRDDWQRPDAIMDALGIASGDRVADVGAGGGWFTIRLAHRVGPAGRVYAEDINPTMLKSIGLALDREGIKNVETRLGDAVDPKLPPGLQAALIVDLYSYFTDPVQMLRNIRGSLAPKGRLGIVDFKRDGAGGPGPDLVERIDPEVIIRDAKLAGLKLRSRETFLKYQYLLVFEK